MAVKKIQVASPDYSPIEGQMNLSNENCCYQIGVQLRVLREIWVIDGVVFHERLKVHHGKSTVFRIIAQLLGCQALF